MFPPPSQWNPWHFGAFVFTLVTGLSFSYIAFACLQTGQETDQAIVATDIAVVENCVWQKWDELHRLPASLGSCERTDPWRNTYAYRPLGPKSFELHSVGPDGISGTQDDTRGQ